MTVRRGIDEAQTSRKLAIAKCCGIKCFFLTGLLGGYCVGVPRVYQNIWRRRTFWTINS